MNPGPVEEGSKVAQSVISVLKESPITLALVVFNALFFAVVYINGQHLRESNERILQQMITNQQENAKMLYNCTPNKPQ